MEQPAAPTVSADHAAYVTHSAIDLKLTLRRSAAEGGIDSLCDRCVSSVIYRRENVITKQVYCTRVGEYVPSDIQSCSSFTDMKEMPLHMMKEIALEINKEALREMGFKTVTAAETK